MIDSPAVRKFCNEEFRGLCDTLARGVIQIDAFLAQLASKPELLKDLGAPDNLLTAPADDPPKHGAYSRDQVEDGRAAEGLVSPIAEHVCRLARVALFFRGQMAIVVNPDAPEEEQVTAAMLVNRYAVQYK